MAATFVNIATASSAGATNLILVKPVGTLEGDLLWMHYVVGDIALEAATLTLPVGWTFAGAASSARTRTLSAFKYAGASEPTQYQFTYTASLPCVASLQAFRGVTRSLTYDPVAYPYGYYAPGGSLSTSSSATSTTLSSYSSATRPSAMTDGVFVSHAFCAYDLLGLSPTLDDPSPLKAVRGRVSNSKLTLLLVDYIVDVPVTPTPTITATASRSVQWRVVSTTFEPYTALGVQIDNYKSKLLRRSFPPPYDARLSSNLGKLLTVIGTSDNDLGGLFGDSDFLPDDTL